MCGKKTAFRLAQHAELAVTFGNMAIENTATTEVVDLEDSEVSTIAIVDTSESSKSITSVLAVFSIAMLPKVTANSAC